MNRRVGLIALLALSLGLGIPPATLALSGADVVAAIDKAKVLDASIRVNAQVTPEVIYISTYKNPKANDRDCKIEAVLLAKTVMELDNKIPRVEIRFYSQNALSRFKKISVSAGDVKAFAAGTMQEDQLLNSLVLAEEETRDPNVRATSHLQENQYARRKREVSSRINKNVLEVSAGLDPTLEDVYLKAEALRLAEKAFEAVGDDIDEVSITFYDGSKELSNRNVTLKRAQQKPFSEALNSALKDLELKTVKAEKLAAEGLDVTTFEPSEGLYLKERKELVGRLRALKEAGVGFSRDVLVDLVAIENGLTTLDEAVLRDKLAKLSAFIGKYEENLKKAKEIKPAAAPKASAAAKTNDPVLSENVDQMKAPVLANPDGYLATMAGRLARRSPTGNGEDHPNFQKILTFAIDILRQAGRTQDAARLETRLKEIKARNGN
ncbi:MAG TPA: hypothetical protein PLY72_14895 [Candidatus Obscuribacter sp.]|nr:hypothetical protein [Candidatus Obscuribacter sp.]HNH72947.1 hypothetical protein [Candidatus Obscuribacter sp.]